MSCKGKSSNLKSKLSVEVTESNSSTGFCKQILNETLHYSSLNSSFGENYDSSLLGSTLLFARMGCIGIFDALLKLDLLRNAWL